MSVSAKESKDELARIQEATDYPVQRSEDGWIVGHFFNCWLSSVFQPVFDDGRGYSNRTRGLYSLHNGRH